MYNFLNEVYPGGNEDEIHLEEDENGVQNRIETSQHGETRRVWRHFQKSAKFKSVVNHRSQSES